MTFNARDYLNSRNIPYQEAGKNVSRGWIGFNCPFCDDPSNHCGVNLSADFFTCFRCPAKGPIELLIMTIEDIEWSEAVEVKKQFHEGTIPLPLDRMPGSKVTFPKNTVDILLDVHREWLEGRGFDPGFIFSKYRLKCVGFLGDWMFRLIIPIHIDRLLVSYVGRDVTNKSTLPYRNAKVEDCIVPVKQCVYNIDKADQTAIVVEGPTDVWNIGNGSVAILGLKYTQAQIRLLSRFRRLFVLLDAGDKEKEVAERLAYDLATLVPEVHVYDLASGDPGNLKQDDVQHLRREIFGKVQG